MPLLAAFQLYRPVSFKNQGIAWLTFAMPSVMCIISSLLVWKCMVVWDRKHTNLHLDYAIWQLLLGAQRMVLTKPP